VRSPDHLDDLEKLVKIGPVTFILVHADWCGPCQSYKPIWSELERSPGRTANMAMIHHDMVEHSPLLKKAKIPGFPTVLKVYPDGKMEEYKIDNQKTNSVPNIRDKETMLSELKSIPVSKFLNTVRNSASPLKLQPKKAVETTALGPNFEANVRSIKSNPIKYKTLNVSHPVSTNTSRPTISVSATRPPLMPTPVPIMKGGALYTALSSALSRAGPAVVLFGASQMLPTKKNTGSNMRLTRKASRSKKNSGKSRKSGRK
jgi:hypothetical protein